MAAVRTTVHSFFAIGIRASCSQNIQGIHGVNFHAYGRHFNVCLLGEHNHQNANHIHFDRWHGTSYQPKWVFYHLFNPFCSMCWHLIKYFHHHSILGSKYPKSKAAYEKSNQLAEQWSKITNFVLETVSVPAIVLPKAIISFIIYYTTDAGPDAFELSVPVW